MLGVSHTELLILAGVLVLLFGASRLPSLMRNMGRSVNEFKQGLKDEPSPQAVDDSPEKIEGKEEVAS